MSLRSEVARTQCNRVIFRPPVLSDLPSPEGLARGLAQSEPGWCHQHKVNPRHAVTSGPCTAAPRATHAE